MKSLPRPSVEMIVAACLFAIAALLSVMSQAGLAHVMSPAGYGNFALLYATGMILSGLGALGYDMAALRFMASTAASGQFEARRAFFKRAIRKTVWGGTALAVVASPVCILAGLLEVLEATALLLLVPAWAALRLFSSVLRTENKAGASIFLDRIARDGSLFILAAVLFLFSYQAGDAPPTVVLVVVTLLSALSGAMLLRRLFEGPVQPVTHAAAPLWSLAARRLLAVNGLELLSGRIDLFLLALIVDKAVVGQMNIVLVLSATAVLPSVLTGFILMPRTAAMRAEGRQDAIAAEVHLATWLNVLSAVVVSVIVVFVIHMFRNAPGMELTSTIPLDILSWMFAARVITSQSMATVALLQMIGRERVVILAHLASLLLKVTLYVLLAEVVDLRTAVLVCVASAALFALIVSLVPRILDAKSAKLLA